jgi:hypothetical protein
LPDVKIGVKQLARVSYCQVNGNINAEKYISALDSQIWPVIARHFPDDSYVFQDDNVIAEFS